ncbi:MULTISPECIES: hypothetical protein [Bacillus cereus group]|uniref:Uncharacterized protein n=2 Tax=Bacillus cereus group TaxID=86661 RepID=R8QW79_BACCE|nr:MULTISPECIES: hypothetical protein [Bacillus cereus group]EOP75300.1 hypothetical protein IIQ_05606 [Bacillus cereus VD118]SCB68926.1 Uncharacterized protein BWGO95_03075 [Bacillus mycoides]
MIRENLVFIIQTRKQIESDPFMVSYKFDIFSINLYKITENKLSIYEKTKS